MQQALHPDVDVSSSINKETAHPEIHSHLLIFQLYVYMAGIIFLALETTCLL